MKHIIVLIALMWASCAFAQSSIFLIEGRTLENKVEFSFTNRSDTPLSINYIILQRDIVQQDDIQMRTFGNTIIESNQTIVIEIDIDFAEYYSFECTVSITGSELRIDASATWSLRLPVLKKRVISITSQVSGTININVPQWLEKPFGLILYDLAGRESFKQITSIGTNHIQTGLPSGVYVAHIKSEDFTENFKVFIR